MLPARSVPSGAILFLTLLRAPGAGANEPATLYYVSAIKDTNGGPRAQPPAPTVVERNGQRHNLLFGESLLEGDALIVQDPDNLVVLCGVQVSYRIVVGKGEFRLKSNVDWWHLNGKAIYNSKGCWKDPA